MPPKRKTTNVNEQSNPAGPPPLRKSNRKAVKATADSTLALSKTTDVDLDDEQSNPAAPLPLKKPAHTAAKATTAKATADSTPASSTAVSAVASSKPMSRSDGDEHRGPLASDSNKSLSSQALVQEVLKMVENRDKAELMVLELMRTYSFSFPRLKELLTQNNLDVSFSKVRYVDIAPKIGLDPILRGDDIPPFEMFRARLPNATFHQIVRDLRVFAAQYGPMGKHENEEARARYLAGYFNQIVALFSGLLFNTPETLLEGRITTKGRIEYQFKTYGGITVVFIEVKLDIGNLTEQLNCFAQVIAECDAYAWMNYQNGFHVPIIAILCDGKYFYFFQFVDRRQANASPRLFLGKFANGDEKVKIDIALDPSTDPRAFFRQVRITCDSLYYVFLSGYQSGLEAYWNRSVERAKAQGKGRDSTPGWHKAKELAKKALKEATFAWDQYHEGMLAESKISAERAVQTLTESVEEAPFKRYGELPDYTEDMADE